MKLKFVCLVSILIIFIFLISYYNEYNQHNEGFTPILKQMVRPHLRKARVHIEGLYNRHTTKLNNIFKKNKLL